MIGNCLLGKFGKSLDSEWDTWSFDLVNFGDICCCIRSGDVEISWFCLSVNFGMERTGWLQGSICVPKTQFLISFILGDKGAVQCLGGWCHSGSIRSGLEFAAPFMENPPGWSQGGDGGLEIPDFPGKAECWMLGAIPKSSPFEGGALLCCSEEIFSTNLKFFAQLRWSLSTSRGWEWIPVPWNEFSSLVATIVSKLGFFWLLFLLF